MNKMKFLKYIYAYMLETLDEEKIDLFWEKHPLTESFSVVRTLDFLCKEKGEVSTECYYSVLNDFSALVDSETMPSDVLEQMFRRSQTAIPLSSEELLSAVAPFAEELYLSEDVYRDIYKSVAPIVTRVLFPGFTCELMNQKLSLPNRTVFIFIHAENDELSSFSEIWEFMRVMLRLLPVCFSLPEAVSVEAAAYRAGARTFEMDDLRFLGEMTFQEFCNLFSDVTCQVFPDKIVSVYEYSTREGTSKVAFGAPGFLFKVSYDGKSPFSKTHLLSILVDSAEQEPDPLKCVFSRHQQILSRHKSSLVYRKVDGRLMRNGKLVARDSTAYILSRILSSFKLEGRSEFENREFMKDPNVVSDPLNPNLVLKLNRAFDAAKKKIPEVKIVRTTRGAFRINEMSPFDYNVE
ncbi:MAG: hypothetical protein ACOC36_00165 [Fibrobacterota bacterium]